ncbi:MAG TPA: hypothetical protein VGZ00_12270 [Candidatus Baltobacteraceae bacterium]|jgi:hypothetical protein|nr:hypothetical protein [Candidatus Baltobacteraceae bacterium]
MRLRLQFPPLASFAPQHAALAVEAARHGSKVDLDYSPESLATVDAIIEQMRNDGIPVDKVGESLFSFGCYVGEVLVRNDGAFWRDTELTPLKDKMGLFSLIVELGNGSFCNPIGKVFKRLENGSVDSLPQFYEIFKVKNS